MGGDAMQSLWQIQLFGELRGTYGDRALARFPTRRSAALLAYLAYFRDCSHSRDELIDVLWPDVAPPARATI